MSQLLTSRWCCLQLGQPLKKPPNAKSAPPAAEAASSGSESSTSAQDDSSEKRKRTVHIDVYCTGSDDEANEDEASECSSEAGSPRDLPVFENEHVRVVHTAGKGSTLPRGFTDELAFLRREPAPRPGLAPTRMASLASSRGYESDDVLSSLYPSRFSSYSRLRDVESSSSVGLADESASVASWRDALSDAESPRASKPGLAPCDSFDYADSLDRERIRRLNAVCARRAAQAAKRAATRGSRAERNEPRPRPEAVSAPRRRAAWSSRSSSSESSDSGGELVGWSFVSSEDNESVVRGRLALPTLDGATSVLARSGGVGELPRLELLGQAKPPTTTPRDRIGTFGSVSPSPPPSKLHSRVTSPFTTPQGEKTEHIVKASRFGRVVDTLRKPGHHVGPAKNPACSCEHCRRHFEDSARRRSRSLDPVGRRSAFRAPSAT